MNSSVKAVAEQYATGVWDKKDLSVIDQLVDSKVVIHSPLGIFHGIQSLKDVVEVWLKGFPDLKVTNDIVISENDLVSMQWRVKATHKGEFKGKKPNGKSISYSGVTVYRVKGDKIVEYWAYIDMQHLLNQL